MATEKTLYECSVTSVRKVGAGGMRHRGRHLLFCVCLTFCLELSIAPRLSGQQTSADGPTAAQNYAQAPQNSGPPDRTVSVRKLPGNILADQKKIFTFPRALTKGEHWWPTIGVTVGTAALIASDPYTAPPFRTTGNFSGFNRIFSSRNTGVFIVAVPPAMYSVGWLRKDSYTQQTALLAAEALADGFIMSIPFKGITARKQPLIYSGNGPYADSFFNGSHNPFRSGGFYSQHAIVSTAVATVIARRYRNHRWVPYVAYGLAGVIGFSRITRSDHFPGDVLFGGTMGYVVSRYTVLPAQN